MAEKRSGVVEFVEAKTAKLKPLLIPAYKYKYTLCHSNINVDIELSCLNIKDNNRYNIYIHSFRYNIKIVVSKM